MPLAWETFTKACMESPFNTNLAKIFFNFINFF
jgi:hypothetical protein